MKRTRKNHQIKAPKVRLIGADGKQIGVVKTNEALVQAEAGGLDLVEISPDADPPVAKLVDWGKYQYEKTKQAQKARRKQKATEVKQIRLGMKIDDHDLNVKLRKANEFLEKGHKVKVNVFFRGREMAHKDLGHGLIKKVAEKLGDEVVQEGESRFSGRQLSTTFRRK